jgi:hypothetical protein
MDIDQMKQIIKELSVGRPIFHSEADLQLSLFRLLSRRFGPENVYFEEENIVENKSMNVDIVVKNAGKNASSDILELKYAPKAMSFYEEHLSEYYRLKDQPVDFNRRAFWIDVERLEKLVRSRQGSQAYVFFLTNNPVYWEDGSCGRQNQDRNYRIHEGRSGVTGRLEFKPSYPKGDVVLGGSYGPLKWNDYSSLGKNGFRYLLLGVK